MNKITQIKNQLEMVRVNRAQSQEPEKFDPFIKNLEDQLEAQRQAAKDRKMARKLKKSTQTSSLAITNTILLATTGSVWTLQDFQLEARIFSNQVIKENEIKGKVVFCSRKISFARKSSMEVHLGSQSLTRAYEAGFAEYSHIKKFIQKYNPKGRTGIRLLVLHELAHLLVFQNYKGRMKPHGYEFQVEYKKLLVKYHSALEIK